MFRVNLYIHRIIIVCIATVWFINGLICKILNIAPRHQAIVSRIVNTEYAIQITKTIGFLEILMAIWIMCRIHSKTNAITQIIIILVMNIIEYILVPDLLLWGKANLLFAIIFIVIIYLNEFNNNLKMNN